jgi:hypothetical protein
VQARQEAQAFSDDAIAEAHADMHEFQRSYLDLLSSLSDGDMLFNLSDMPSILNSPIESRRLKHAMWVGVFKGLWTDFESHARTYDKLAASFDDIEDGI